MKTTETLVLDSCVVDFDTGETILEVARRNRVEIPTLCHDPRLKPAGACRMCLVEIEGWRRAAPSCATIAEPGMVVHTSTEKLRRHRKALLALYMADHSDDFRECETGSPCELHRLAENASAPVDWPKLSPVRTGYQYANPYIAFRPDRCILCAQCVRYCNEVEAVSAITLARRGPQTTISTADNVSLLDTTCELCGGCIGVCPTGAMTEQMPLSASAKPERKLRKVRTTCNYCGVGCQLDLVVDDNENAGRGAVVKISSPPAGTIPNDGNLCVKGRFAYKFIGHPERLTTPLARSATGTLEPISWDEAIRRTAAGLQAVKDKHGADALGFVSSSRCTSEENYLLQKLARAAFGTNNAHQCAAT